MPKSVWLRVASPDGLVNYAHIGTGNFNEKTAQGCILISACLPHTQGITAEVGQVFNFMQHSYRHYNFEHLIVSPNHTRSHLCSLIDNEIANAKQGRHAEIKFKLNNIDDVEVIISRLYEASSAGVMNLYDCPWHVFAGARCAGLE